MGSGGRWLGYGVLFSSQSVLIEYLEDQYDFVSAS